MIPVNKHLFDLSEIYDNWSYQETWYATSTLRKQRQELIICLQHIINNRLFDAHYKEEEEAVRKQLFYLDKNIKTLEDVLLCHETKIFEKRSSLEELGIIGLN